MNPETKVIKCIVSNCNLPAAPDKLNMRDEGYCIFHEASNRMKLKKIEKLKKSGKVEVLPIMNDDGSAKEYLCFCGLDDCQCKPTACNLITGTYDPACYRFDNCPVCARHNDN